MPDMGQRYWAFISYSHADSRWAEWLHRQLEAYAVPRRLVGQPTSAGPAPARFRPVFKDMEELGAAPDLSERLRSALSQSAWLIVVCSPAAAKSRWVDEEIRQFKRLHGEARVLAVITGGEPFASDDPDRAALECLPAALRSHMAAEAIIEAARLEPVAADLRPGRGSRRLALLKLLSGMLGIDLGQLVQRDARRRNRQLLALTGASLAAAAVLGALAVAALVERNEAVAQRGQAEGLIEFMIGDLKSKLEPAGRLDALDAVGARALTYYAAQQSHGLDAASLGRRARVLQLLGEIRDRRGDLDAALRLFKEAAASTGELLRRHPNDPQRIYDHAQSVFWVGYMASRRGQDDEALRAYQDYERLADQLVRIDPNNADWRAEVDYADWDVGSVLLDEGRADEAAASFQRALSIGSDLARRAPADRDRQFNLGQNDAWLADAEYYRGRLDPALADRMAERAIYARLIQQNPSDAAATLALAVNRCAVARILIAKGLVREAIAALKTSKNDMDRLIAAAPDDAHYKDLAGPNLILLGQAYLQAGDLGDAETIAREASDKAEFLVRKDPTVTDWQGPRLGGARVLLIQIAAARAGTRAGQVAALAPAAREAGRLAALARPGRDNLLGVDAAAAAALLAGDHASLTGDAAAAKASWTAAKGLLDRAQAGGLPENDRSRVLLRQLDYRLRLSHPPIGSTPGERALTPRPDYTSASKGIDYRW
ncbi:MAG TPA: TIR domain-containing protein [Caulobacteraceae bacterium]|jgi:tetratricopeptide (TPR) repeat protein|nr:TIR domain-containing protein [Caulobacteraceae bacterium]